LWVELNRIHREGIADLIDKQPPPNYMIEFLPSFLVEEYKNDFKNTPKKLKHLDSLLLAHSHGALSKKEFSNQLNNYFKFGGHPNGYYMALKIKEQLGLQVLIDSFNDPIAFVRLYQDAETKETSSTFFSRQFMDFVKGIEQVGTDK
jgi:hypothetical protein